MLWEQVVPICVPDLELVRVAQILTISSELCQAYKFAVADARLRKQFNLETRVSLAAAARFTATDYLQVAFHCIAYRALFAHQRSLKSRIFPVRLGAAVSPQDAL